MSVRSTIAKTQIQNIILESKVALSANEIQVILNDSCDRVTVYRVLNRLTTEGLIHKIVNTDGVIKYAGCNDCSKKHNHNHIHFSCINCKSVTCLNVEPVFSLPEKYSITETNFTISGFCPLCS